MSSRRRTFEWILAALLIIVIIMSGVTIYYDSAILSEITKTPTTTKPTITVYALWSGVEEANFRELLGNFTQQTGINISYYGYTTQDLLISVPLQLKAPPYSVDVVIAPWPYWILQQSAYLEPVNDVFDVTKFPTSFISPVNDSSGQIWAMPFKLSGKPGFWYRPSFFAAHGLTVPTTYAQFNNTLLPAIKAIPGVEQAIASGDSVGWPLTDTTEGFLMGLGGYQLQLDLETGPKARNWTDPQVRDPMSNLTQLITAGYFSPPAEWTSQIDKLWNGKYGIYWQGNFITAQSQVKNVSDISFFGFPGTTGVSGSIDYAIIPKYAPHLAEAKQLVQYMSTAPAQTIMVGLGGFLGTNKDVAASAYNPVDKKVIDFMGQAGIHVVPDLDDTIGGAWQTTFWSELKLLWTDPTKLDSVLSTLQTAAIQQQGV
jgi:multiple sugar transport system substrate-binding protein